MSDAKRRLVYDLPTRVFHLLFSGLFIAAFMIAKTSDDDSTRFPYHMLLGITLGALVTLRLVWGFLGTRYARWNSFALNPAELAKYFVGVVKGDRKKWPGHNPASSWAALGMIGCALGQVTSGLALVNGVGGEFFEEAHEWLANGFLVLAIVHVVGVVLHMGRHRDAIALSMVDGKKSGISESEAISGSRAGVGVLFLGLMAAISLSVVKAYDFQSRTLTLFGRSMQLGETEESEHEGDASGEQDGDHDD